MQELRKLCKTDSAAEPDIFHKTQQLDEKMIPLVNSIEKMLTTGICQNFHVPTSDCTLQKIKCQITKCVTFIINDIMKMIDQEGTRLVLNTEETCHGTRNESNASQMIEALVMMDDEARSHIVKGIEDTFLNPQSIDEGCVNKLLEKWFHMNPEETDRRTKSCNKDLFGDELALIDRDTVSGRVKAWLLQEGKSETCGDYDVTNIILHVLMDHIGKYVLHSDRAYTLENSGTCRNDIGEKASEMSSKKHADIQVNELWYHDKTLRDFAKGYIDGIILNAQKIVIQDAFRHNTYEDLISEEKEKPDNRYAMGTLVPHPDIRVEEPISTMVVKDKDEDAILRDFTCGYVEGILIKARESVRTGKTRCTNRQIRKMSDNRFGNQITKESTVTVPGMKMVDVTTVIVQKDEERPLKDFAKEIVSKAQKIIQQENASGTIKHENCKVDETKNRVPRNITQQPYEKPTLTTAVKSTSNAMLEIFARDYVNGIVWKAREIVLKEAIDDQRYKVPRLKIVRNNVNSQRCERIRAEILRIDMKRRARLESTTLQEWEDVKAAAIGDQREKTRNPASKADLKEKKNTPNEILNNKNEDSMKQHELDICITKEIEEHSPSATTIYVTPIETEPELEKESPTEFIRKYVDGVVMTARDKLRNEVGGTTKYTWPQNRIPERKINESTVKSSTAFVPQVNASDTATLHLQQDAAMRNFAKFYVNDIIRTARGIVMEQRDDKKRVRSVDKYIKFSGGEQKGETQEHAPKPAVVKTEREDAPVQETSNVYTKQVPGGELLSRNTEADIERPAGLCGFVGLCGCQLFSCIKRKSSTH